MTKIFDNIQNILYPVKALRISKINARQILDSRGNPTVETDVILENGVLGRAAVPSGASTGEHEAVELRDKDLTQYGGKGVLKAIANVEGPIAKTLSKVNAFDQLNIDHTLIKLDNTPNKSQLGANAILSVSIAVAKAAANSQNKPLYEYFAEIAGVKKDFVLPVPQINIVNGGKHGSWATDIQEYMILPVGAESFSKAVQMASEVFHSLGKVLSKKGYRTTVGDEGGYSPIFRNGNAEPLMLISEAVEQAGYKLGKDIAFGIDAAASEFYNPSDDGGKYELKREGKSLTTGKMVSWLSSLVKKFPVVSLEDCLDQNDWKGWQLQTKELGNKYQIVGDDIFVTNIAFLERGIAEKSANAILIKLNQIGTVTETIAAINLAKKNGWNTVISHRSGETEDTTITHLAVGLSTKQIKTGSMSRTDRVAKYNELMRIEEELGEKAKYAGNIFKN